MMHLRLFVLTAIVTIAAPHVGAADPINITAGFLDMNPIFGPLVLSGDRGFTFSSGVDVVGGIFRPWGDCNLDPLHCRPGDTLNLGASWSGNDAGGTATLEGIAYSQVGSLSSFSSITVQFSGMAVLPALQTGTVTITAPFLFSGSFFHPVDNTALGFPTVTESLVGSGSATLALTRNRGFPGSWHVDHARYEFASVDATPEPGPLLLMGAGLLGVAAMFRRGMRRQRVP